MVVQNSSSQQQITLLCTWLIMPPLCLARLSRALVDSVVSIQHTKVGRPQTTCTLFAVLFRDHLHSKPPSARVTSCTAMRAVTHPVKGLTSCLDVRGCLCCEHQKGRAQVLNTNVAQQHSQILRLFYHKHFAIRVVASSTVPMPPVRPTGPQQQQTGC
jgi:hypothetical protein